MSYGIVEDHDMPAAVTLLLVLLLVVGPVAAQPADCNGNGLPDVGENLPDCDQDQLADVCEYAGVQPGHALRFVGLSGYVMPGPTLAGGAITIEAWVYPFDAIGKRSIVRKSPNNYWLWIFGGQPRFGYLGSAGSTYRIDADVPPLEWTHLAVAHRFGSATVHAYVNGVPVSGTWGQEPAGDPLVDAGPVHIGDNPTGDGKYRGLLDQVRVWSVVRGPAQIEADRFTTPDPNTPGLELLLTFDAGGGDQFENAVTGARSEPAVLDWVPLAACLSCGPDANGDGTVDLADLAIVLRGFGSGQATRGRGDLSGDGRVTTTDLALVLSQFGLVCE